MQSELFGPTFDQIVDIPDDLYTPIDPPDINLFGPEFQRRVKSMSTTASRAYTLCVIEEFVRSQCDALIGGQTIKVNAQVHTDLDQIYMFVSVVYLVGDEVLVDLCESKSITGKSDTELTMWLYNYSKRIRGVVKMLEMKQGEKIVLNGKKRLIFAVDHDNHRLMLSMGEYVDFKIPYIEGDTWVAITV